MANDSNLKPFDQRTEAEQRAIATKGGIASGEARRKKADLRKAVNDAMQTEYTDKNGKSVTGKEAFIQSLIANISNPNSRNWAKAANIIIELTGANIAPEVKKKIEAETKLLEKQLKDSGKDSESVTVVIDV